MTTKNLLFVTAFIFHCSLTAFGQTNPPTMAMPEDSSIILIDKIIEITKHEKYFIEYCTKKVKNYSIENNWTQEKTNQILESLKFKYYNSTIYNSYAFYSIDQLKILVETLTLINNDTKNNLTMVLTNSMMQNNLDLFVDGVIKGKYVMTK